MESADRIIPCKTASCAYNTFAYTIYVVKAYGTVVIHGSTFRALYVYVLAACIINFTSGYC